jgi:hypothetical protein
MDKIRTRNINARITNVIADYLTNRKILIDNKTEMEVGGGVPHGSELGPTLWNIMYDDIMRVAVPADVGLVCYADDLAVSVTAATVIELVSKTNETLFSIAEWMKRNELSIAPQKTVAVMLSGSRRAKDIRFEFEGSQIAISKEATYLGVVLDSNLNFSKHIAYVTSKAQRTARALSILLPNTRGPKQNKRKTMATATQSLLQYAAPVWECSLKVKSRRDALLAAQRPMILRVCCAYRTVSH